MFKLDNNLLIELGLGAIPPIEKNRLLAQIYETLEMRVGIKLAEGMSDQQLDEFETLMPMPTDTPDAQKQKEGQAHKWLETNFPNYKQVVADELAKLKEEVKGAAPQIVASVQANPMHPPTGQQPTAGGAPTPAGSPPQATQSGMQAPAAAPPAPAPVNDVAPATPTEPTPMQPPAQPVPPIPAQPPTPDPAQATGPPVAPPADNQPPADDQQPIAA